MSRLFVIKTGSAIAEVRHLGDFPQWMQRGAGVPCDVVDVEGGEALPALEHVRGAIITGSVAMVTDRLDWSERTAHWIASAAAKDIPLLGICYGHQLLAHALGGSVGDNPRGRQIGTAKVLLTLAAQEDPLLGPFIPSLMAQTSHLQSVLQLPPHAQLLGHTALDPHHCFRVGNSWGVQFHPEFNDEVMRGYLQARHETIAAENLDPLSLLTAVEATPTAELVLARFAHLTERLHRDPSHMGAHLGALPSEGDGN